MSSTSSNYCGKPCCKWSTFQIRWSGCHRQTGQTPHQWQTDCSPSETQPQLGRHHCSAPNLYLSFLPLNTSDRPHPHCGEFCSWTFPTTSVIKFSPLCPQRLDDPTFHYSSNRYQNFQAINYIAEGHVIFMPFQGNGGATHERRSSWSCDSVTISYASRRGTNRCRRCKQYLAEGELRFGVSDHHHSRWSHRKSVIVTFCPVVWTCPHDRSGFRCDGCWSRVAFTVCSEGSK